jgi:hypothetical protein
MSRRGSASEALSEERAQPGAAMNLPAHVTPAESGPFSPWLDGDVRRGFAATTPSGRAAFAVTFLIAAAGSLFLTLGMGLQHNPDATLYTSGFSFFPSPLGTALGTLLGIEGLAIVQALVIGAAATAVVALRVPLRCIAVAFPILIWIAPLGVDVIAGALFAWGWWRGRERWYWIAAGFHLSALLLVVAVSRARWIAAIALALGATLLVVTPYGAGLRTAAELERAPQALVGGLLVAALALLPGLVAGVRVWEGTYLALGVAVALGTAYAVRFDLSDGYVLWTSVPQTLRYAFPVVFVCFIEAARVVDRTSEEAVLVVREADA